MFFHQVRKRNYRTRPIKCYKEYLKNIVNYTLIMTIDGFLSGPIQILKLYKSDVILYETNLNSAEKI